MKSRTLFIFVSAVGLLLSGFLLYKFSSEGANPHHHTLPSPQHHAMRQALTTTRPQGQQPLQQDTSSTLGPGHKPSRQHQGPPLQLDTSITQGQSHKPSRSSQLQQARAQEQETVRAVPTPQQAWKPWQQPSIGGSHRERQDLQAEAVKQGVPLAALVAEDKKQQPPIQALDKVPIKPVLREVRAWNSQQHKLSQNEQARGISAPRGYLFPLSFTEQMESGMYDLHQLSQLAQAWGAALAEPYVKDSKLHLPSRPFDHTSLLKLSEIYNLSDLNSNLRKSLGANYDLIVPLGRIKEDARRNATNVHIVVTQFLSYSVSQDACQTTHARALLADLSPLTRPCQGSILKCPVSFVCLNTKRKNNFRNLLKTHPDINKVQQRSSMIGSKMLIVVPKWNGIRKDQDKFFYWDPSFPKIGFRHPHATWHSDWVQSTAKGFHQALQLEPPVLGIHLRLERLLRTKPRNTTRVRECINKMISVVASLQNTKQISSAVMFRDYGHSGSTTCAGIGCSRFASSSHIDERVHALGVKVEEYQSHSEQVHGERGFIANVEQEVLARADKLLLVGYGSFQIGIAQRYLRRHDRPPGESNDIFKICSG